MDITKFADYNKVNKLLKSSLRNAEIVYYSNQFNLHKNDLAKSWKILMAIIGTNSEASINTTFTINDKLLTDSKDIANGFNNYIVSIGLLLANDIRCSVNPMSYVNGIQRLARVVPILKAGDPSQIANYIPISVVTFFSKVFEKIMYNCILKCMDDNHVFYEHQYGFRQKHSTQQTIIIIVYKIITSLDKGDIVISVFLDLKKAFDTVDHHILLKKLYAYGIRGHIIKWFESYLYDRSQYVIYNNEYSETHPIKCGVPQGSILGPLLFIIYVNDICNISNFLFNIMYADDTSLLLSGDDLKDLRCLLNKELELLFIWLKSNKLSLNTQNTFYMLFHRARIKGNNSVVKINDSVLNRVNNMKYLGVIIDHKLKCVNTYHMLSI